MNIQNFISNEMGIRVRVYRAMDFGSQNPTVCLWIAVDDDDNWYVIDEHYESGQTIDYHSGIINAKSQGIPIVATYGDPSGTQWISEFAQRGIYITSANKEVGTNFNSWVRFKIAKIEEKLKCIPGKTVNIPNRNITRESQAILGGLNIRMPSLFVFNNCVNTIREFETYRWKEKSVTQAQDLNEPDVPEKANDHAMDALSYFAVSYKKREGNYIIPKDDISLRNWSLK